MDRILVGVHAPSAALRWAGDLAAHAGLPLTLARVFEPQQAELPPEEVTTLEADQRAEAVGWCADLPAGSPEPEVVLLEGEPADALLDAAADRRADLLVVGAVDAPSLPHLGSTAHRLVHHTEVPLAIVPAGADQPIDHLVVGVDGSATSRGAVELVAAIAKPLGVGVTAVMAFEPVLQWVPRDDPDSWFTHAQAQVREWTQPIADTGVEVDIDVDEDVHPVAALQRALDAHPGSTAVVGARGLGGFTGLRLGRVPLQLLHHSERPVIVVPVSG